MACRSLSAFFLENPMKTRLKTLFAPCRATLLVCLAALGVSHAWAAGRPYDVQEISCSDPADSVCLSWNLQAAPGGSRTSSINVTLMQGESISGVVKPKANRYTTTKLIANPDLEVYIGMGFEPNEKHFTCRVTAQEECRMKGRNLPDMHFKVKAITDTANTRLGYMYTVAK